MKYVTRGLAILLVTCLIIRLGFYLIAPAIPALALLLVVAAILQFMLFGGRY
jgi:hypothetical protein